MLRPIVIAAMFAVAVPALAVAQGTAPQEHRPAAGPPARGAPHLAPGPRPGGPPPGARTVGPPHGPIAGPPGGAIHGGPPGGAMHVGGPAGPGGQFTFHGHPFNRVHLAPFAYPPGYGYQRWAVGGVLPPLFLTPAYYYTDWATLGFDAPPPGTQWVRYGPDLLLVDVNTGQVLDVVYGAFYE